MHEGDRSSNPALTTLSRVQLQTRKCSLRVPRFSSPGRQKREQSKCSEKDVGLKINLKRPLKYPFISRFLLHRVREHFVTLLESFLNNLNTILISSAVRNASRSQATCRVHEPVFSLSFSSAGKGQFLTGIFSNK